MLIKLKFIIPGNIDPLCCIPHHPNSTFLYSHHHPNCPALDGWLARTELPLSGQWLVRQRQRPENLPPYGQPQGRVCPPGLPAGGDVSFSASLTWGGQEETGWKRFRSGEIGQDKHACGRIFIHPPPHLSPSSFMPRPAARQRGGLGSRAPKWTDRQRALCWEPQPGKRPPPPRPSEQLPFVVSSIKMPQTGRLSQWDWAWGSGTPWGCCLVPRGQEVWPAVGTHSYCSVT